MYTILAINTWWNFFFIFLGLFILRVIINRNLHGAGFVSSGKIGGCIKKIIIFLLSECKWTSSKSERKVGYLTKNLRNKAFAFRFKFIICLNPRFVSLNAKVLII